MLLGSALFTAWAAAVAISDCRRRRVPNALVLAGLVTAIACTLVRASPFGTAPLQAVAGAALGLFVLLPFFLLRVMGAADVKVFAVLGAWCGSSALPGVWVVASVAAGLHAIVLIAAAHVPLNALWRGGEPTFSAGRRRAAPYAAFLVAAAALLLIGRPLAGGAS